MLRKVGAMRHLFARALSLCLVAAVVPAVAEPGSDDQRIKDMLVGRSAVFADYSVATYGTDGGYSYVAANNMHYKGRYTLAGDKLCITIEHGEARCDRVGIDQYGPYLFTKAGEQLRFGTRAPMSWQTMTTLCGVPVAYTVQPPAGNVPKEVAAFSGTWVGKWDYGMCGALVVESVQPNGVATVIYVNGSFNAGQSFKAGAVRFRATIVDNKLSDGGKTSSFDATLNGNELAVRRTGPPGAGTARFVHN